MVGCRIAGCRVTLVNGNGLEEVAPLMRVGECVGADMVELFTGV